MLLDLPALWAHPGVDDRQRRELIHEAFEEVVIRGHDLTSVSPRPQYAPLFAYAICRQQNVMGNGRGDWTRTSDLVVPDHARYQLRHTPTKYHLNHRPDSDATAVAPFPMPRRYRQHAVFLRRDRPPPPTHFSR
jgi:hypothetical protein